MSTTGPDEHDVIRTVGARLKQLRVRRDMSLRTVAARADVSPSLLSSIERGQTNPSLVSLMALADALGVRPGVLLDTDEDDSHQVVIPREDRRIMDAPFCRREYMMRLDDPAIEACELVVPPDGYSRSIVASHSGRDYALVLAGQPTLVLGDQEHELAPGDFTFFEGSTPHRLVNHGKVEARVFWVVVFADRAGAEPGGVHED